MSVLGIVLMVVVGFCAGILARAQLHGSDNVVVTMTALSAILGALVGGFIGNAIWKPREGARITFSMFLKGLVGASILLIVRRLLIHWNGSHFGMTASAEITAAVALFPRPLFCYNPAFEFDLAPPP